MKKEVIYSDRLKETLYKYILDNGLELFVLPKRDQSSNYAIYGTKFGSVHTDFVVDGKTVYKMPQGIAHFLEHKLFESEECDAFELFNQTGASANAYTSFDRTCYLFSCTDDFYKSYDILLNFVQSPYFSEETVLKEQGIIGQEIKMYDDRGSWRVFMNALKALYKNIPINVDITGTVEEIAKITAKTLYDCYNSFYSPQNMFICVCGNVNEDELYDYTVKRVKDKNFVDSKMLFEYEPEDVCQKYISTKLQVSMPQFVIAYKESVNKGEFISNKQRLIKTLLLDVLVSKKSPLYKKLLEENLINNDFSAEVFEGPGYCSIMISGESNNPLKVKEEILNEVKRLKNDKISEVSFEMARKQLYGSIVKDFDSVESIVGYMVDGAVAGYNLFDTVDVLNEITLNDLQNELVNNYNEDKMIVSVVEPMDRKEK